MKLTICLITSCLLVLPALSQAQSKRWSGLDFTKKATARANTRWSLSEWMEMKERNRMMDMWLSMNAPSPYEFVAGTGYKSFTSENIPDATEESHGTYSGEFSAYAQLFGISAEYENNSAEKYNDLSGLFNIRILGNSVQNTNITISVGQRTRSMTSPVTTNLNQQFGQAVLDLHITKYFGLEGKYRQYLKKDDSKFGNEIQETLTEGGIFLDFSSVRIYGSWYQEDQKRKDVNTASDLEQKRTGIKSGIKFFF